MDQLHTVQQARRKQPRYSKGGAIGAVATRFPLSFPIQEGIPHFSRCLNGGATGIVGCFDIRESTPSVYKTKAHGERGMLLLV